MTEYHNGILCIEAGWLYGEGDIMSKPHYDKLKRDGWLNVLRRGCKGTPALISFDSIPERFKREIKRKIGDPRKETKHRQFKDRIEIDAKAMEYFTSYRLPDGRNLPEDTIKEYVANASILKAINEVISDRIQLRRALGGRTTRIWEKIAEVVEDVKGEYNHTLPSNYKRLKERYKLYATEGLISLIHRNYCNDHARKVNDDIERLILSLYTMPNKPYTSSVHELYMQFLGGAIDVVDRETGEIFNREDFYENGEPISLSESTCWNYINDPKNRLLVDKVRTSSLEFNDNHRPHHHRMAPTFSLSKISLDDRDLPRKMPDGTRVKAYYAYDVASGAVVGVAYSRFKDTGLFLGCIKDMFLFLEKNGMGTPMEVEVEHHIVSRFKDDLMKAGVVFPFVRWCAPGNSQEKRAEHFNRAKKYGYEKKYQEGIGRFYSKLEANRPKVEKVASETNDQYNDKRYTFEQLVADDREMIEKYNNDLHRNQKRYKGQTKLQFLLNNQNPNVAAIDKPVLMRYIGEKTQTTVRRSQYVRVRYADYQIPSPQVLKKLSTNSYEVDAYWQMEDDGNISSVYLWQGSEFICEAKKIVKYNEATAEQTEADRAALTEQAKYVAKFDKMVKDERGAKILRVETMSTKKIELPSEEEVVRQPIVLVEPEDEFERLLNGYDCDESSAVDNL